jgi:GntR family transcriptional regulator
VHGDFERLPDSGEQDKYNTGDDSWGGVVKKKKGAKNPNGAVPGPTPEGPSGRALGFRYQAIAEALRSQIAQGLIAPGRLLPSEADLSREHQVSRVTVRKALEALRDEALIDSRQGFGWFVATDPLRQTLGRLGTIESQMAASGVKPERRVLSFGFVPAPKRVAKLLSVQTVLQATRLNLADGEPFARVTVWVPEDLAGELSRSNVERTSFYELLPVVVGGATQTIGAAAATEDDARLLEIPIGSPVLRCERITHDTDGRAVLVSEFVFPGHRTEFVVDLAHAEPSIAPTGLRLVE